MEATESTWGYRELCKNVILLLVRFCKIVHECKEYRYKKSLFELQQTIRQSNAFWQWASFIFIMPI